MKTAPHKYKFAVAVFSMFIRVAQYTQARKYLRWLVIPLTCVGFGFCLMLQLYYTTEQVYEIQDISVAEVYAKEIEEERIKW